MKNKKNLAIASLVLSLVSIIPFIISPTNLTAALIVTIIAIILAIVGIVLGFIGKSASKGLGISGIVIGFIACFLLSLAVFGFMVIQNVKDCVDNGDETSTCSYMGVEVNVPNSMLTDEQKAKGE